MNVLIALSQPVGLSQSLLAEFQPGECLGIALLLVVVLVAGLFRLVLGPSKSQQNRRYDPKPYDEHASMNLPVLILLAVGLIGLAVFLFMFARAN
jgi:uncharacterized BrkB/YihY/UPF0761 family membrane protein